ncbi:probable 28S ribosomal protein S23, mitochondrial [Condylostylus longicornis]|uniref:probable 28S ribosomal protein S23, mitochondrial n=1 Tax=Condylostylus longicornis TaxID=2530218 RepID=UPI00244DD42F|nr:probable 28S ribosomal protein S23, mitochondrial [Condylostylus longicornis]
MAQSRLEKIGTIFTRVTGLLKSGAMKPEDKPLWYEVYAAFPPNLEPKFDRPIPNIKLKKIFYEEDVIRSHYHKINKGRDTINLKDLKSRTQCQQYIDIYNNLKSQGALDEEKIREVAYEMLQDKIKVETESNDNVIENVAHADLNKNSTHVVNVKDLFKE